MNTERVLQAGPGSNTADAAYGKTLVPLSESHLGALRSALVQDFDRAGLDTLTRTQFDVKLETIVAADRNLNETASALVDWAVREIGVKELLAAAIRENPAGPSLVALAAEWSTVEFDLTAPCPYPGLLPFNAASARYFFGRDREILQLQQRLGTRPALAVIGISGCGKSSLLFGGLLPALTGHDNATGSWIVHTLRPGATPAQNLSDSLAGIVDIPRHQLVSDSQDPQASAQRAIKHLVVIDQFEEAFTLGKEEAGSFLSALLDLIQVDGVHLLVAIASEYFSLLQTSPLWPQFENRLFSILPLDADNLRAAIVKPAAAVGVQIEGALVERLIGESEGIGTILPFLQETMVMLWSRLKGLCLTLTDYEQMATLAGDGRSALEVAIEQHAEDTLALPELEKEQIAVKRIFMRLVQFGEGHPHTRRRQTKTQLASGTAPGTVDSILRILVAQRLLVAYGGTDSDAKGVAPEEQSYDLAHDKLIAGWPRLSGWIVELEQGEVQRRRLEDKAAEHKRLGEGGALLDDKELREAEAYLDSDAGAVLGASADAAELMAASRRESNPGWNRMGAVLLITAVLAVVLWSGVLALATITLQPNVQLAVMLSTLVVLVTGVVALWLTARSRSHMLQHWTQWLGHRPFTGGALAVVTACSLIGYAVVGAPLIYQAQYCQAPPRHFEVPKDGAIHVALVNEGLSTFNVGVVQGTLAAWPRINAWLTSADDARQCDRFFQHVVFLRELRTSDGTWSMMAQMEGESNDYQPLVFNDSCAQAQTLALSLAKEIDSESVVNLPAGDSSQAERPDRCEALVLNDRAVAALGAGDLDTAESLLRQTIARFPDYDVAYSNLGDVLRQKNDSDASIAQYVKAVELAPSSPFNVYKLAAVHYSRYPHTHDPDDLLKAQEYFSRTIAIDDEFVPAYSSLAYLHITDALDLATAARLLTAADRILDTTGRYSPEEATRYRAQIAKNKGLLAAKAGNYEQAVTEFTHADELGDWYDKEALSGLADAYLSLGQTQAACDVRSRLATLYADLGMPAPPELLDALANCRH